MVDRKEPKLLIPGPVSLDPRVSEAMTKPLVNHRSENFRELFRNIAEKMKVVYRADEGMVLTLTGSGTLAVEAMVYSMVKPGENVLLLNHGEFGERLKKSLLLRGASVDELKEDYGKAAEKEVVIRALNSGKYSVLAFVYTESTTGLSYRDADAISEVAKEKGMRVIVDATSALVAEHLNMGSGHFDAVSSASQKCIAAPPGISFVGLSKEASKFIYQVDGQPRYLDLRLYKESLDKNGDSPTTPAVNLLYGLDVALDILLRQGLEARMKVHGDLARLLYGELPRQGYLPLVQEGKNRATSVTAFWLPEHLNSRQVQVEVNKAGYEIAAGQGAIKDQIIRVGTMGNIEKNDIEKVISILSSLKRRK